MFEDVLIELRQVLNRDEFIYQLMAKELGGPGPFRPAIESALLATGIDPGRLDTAMAIEEYVLAAIACRKRGRLATGRGGAAQLSRRHFSGASCISITPA